MRRAALGTAATSAAVFFWLLLTLPPRPFSVSLDGVDAALRSRTVSGAYHIHTSRSDGSGSKATVAAAAARAGLKFLIFTEHGDGTESWDPPQYIGGVLAVDGVEIGTNGGHYVALDMPSAPYPLGGEPSAVVEDVRRLGGFGVAAHPNHPRRELAWQDWTVPIDGLEWINADAEWRDEGALAIARVLFGYLFRPGPAVASVFDRPTATLQRWDSLNTHRHVVALAGADAHGSAATGRREVGGAVAIGPSYEAVFRSMTNRILLDRAPTGEAAADAKLLFAALRAGRVYSVVDAVSSDALLDASGEAVSVASVRPPGAEVFTVTEGDRRRIEIHAAKAPGSPPVPWVQSNWTGRYPAPDSDETIPSRATVALPFASEWRVEKDPASSGRVSGAPEVVTVEYALAAGSRASQFVAAVIDIGALPAMDSLVFRGRATRPMRISVQLRFSPNDARWVKSLYLDGEERELSVPLTGMLPAERSIGQMPALASARSLLFVVDLVNARPGDTGAFTVAGARGQKRAQPPS